MAEHLVCLVTAPNQEEAQKIARLLVGQHLVACVNLVPGVTSIYWWEGAVQEDQEVLMVMKTCADRVEELIAAVKANHPYSVPEVISLAVGAGNPDYLNWVSESTRPA